MKRFGPPRKRKILDKRSGGRHRLSAHAGSTRFQILFSQIRYEALQGLASAARLDTLLAVSESLYEEFRDPSSVAPALLNRMVEAGLLGRKTGRGFYDYSRN